MTSFTLTHPTATLSRGIENLVIYGEDSNLLVKGCCGATARLISTVVFPVILTLELLFSRIPKMVLSIGTEKFQQKSDKVLKYSLSIVPSMIFGLYSPEGMPGFFLKLPKTTKEIRPFGVEKIFGKKIDGNIDYPKKIRDVQQIVKEARKQRQQISIIGAGLSQGTQTIPKVSNQRVIDTQHLNHIQVNKAKNTVTVGSGATWEQIQLELDKANKSAIVKQASDIFSIGGSIGINCHGWAHEYGAISQTVRSLKVVDAEGTLRTLDRPRQGIPTHQLTPNEMLFKCMFGTLGYFGVIVEATLDIVDNESLIEETMEVDPDHFLQTYNTQIKGQDIPLFGGRLVLDAEHGDPLRNVCMVRYRKPEARVPLNQERILEEPKYGTRLERIALKLVSHLPRPLEKKMISRFWESERAAMLSGRVLTRNEALHPPINAFKILHESNMHAQWLQEYFIDGDRLPSFLRFLGAELKANDVRLVNATIRPTPKDDISILPYAEKDRFAVVICFAQKKTEAEIEKTRKWIENVNAYVTAEKGVFYQAYMPYATVEQFETCYGKERVEEMRRLKEIFDPQHVFGNAHTAKYYDKKKDEAVVSPFRTVFGSELLKSEFVKFLKTIFYQLDDKKVLEEMEKILADPTKTDKQVYEELVTSIDRMRARFPALFHQLKALSVLQKGMGLQAATLMKDFRPEEFDNYLEVYFRRYLKTIQKTANLPLKGKIYDVSDKPHDRSLKEKLEAGAPLSSYPYKESIPLNDPDCVSPETQPDKTHKPIGNEVPDGGVDLIGCLGGLHHIPKERVDAFADSMFRKLKPGGVVLLRDHDVTSPELNAIASVVHSFVNATAGVKWEVENREIREFHSARHWTEFMQAHHFTRISPENLILQDDPTQNGMMAFVRNPMNLEELQAAAKCRKDCVRSPDSTRATWIEWGNVRYSKQFAEFIQTKHPYAFDYIGHLKQHWNYFSRYIKESRKDLSMKEIVFSDNFAMNFFILVSTTFQCLTGSLGSLPSMLAARIKHGVNWRNATDLTALEKFEAKVEKEYSEYIDHTPFYMFPYLSKIQGLWSAIWNSSESKWTKLTSSVSAISSTVGFGVKAAISAPIRMMYTQNGQYVESERVSILIHDPKNQFQTGEKLIGGELHNIKVVYQTPDGYKLVSVPRYRPFTELCKELVVNQDIKLVEVGSQKKITIDVLYKKNEATLKIPFGGNVTFLYETEKLQDLEEKRYATYEVNVDTLLEFQRALGIEKIEYIHE